MERSCWGVGSGGEGVRGGRVCVLDGGGEVCRRSWCHLLIKAMRVVRVGMANWDLWWSVWSSRAWGLVWIE